MTKELLGVGNLDRRGSRDKESHLRSQGTNPWRPRAVAGLVAVCCAVFASSASAADPCPNASMRALQDSAFLPECRAYEMVSPADKNHGSVLWSVGGLPVSGLNASTADGETVAYASYQPFPGTSHGDPQSYRATRTATGWVTTPTSPAPASPNALQNNRAQVIDATDDFSRSIFETRENFDPLDQDMLSIPGFGVFKFPDVYARNDDGPMEFISRGNAGTPYTEFVESFYVGRSADARTVYFESSESLTPDAAPMVGGVNYLYARGPGGTRLINTDEGGALLSDCGASLGGYFPSGPPLAAQATTKNAVSADGKRAFFIVPDGWALALGQFDPSCLVPAELYVRDGDAVIDASASQMTVPDTLEHSAAFQGATRDGSRVFFTRADRLTDDATSGGGLYAYNVETGKLSFLSKGATDPAGAQVEGVVKSSEDGTHVYFLAKGQLVAGQGVAGSDNLYLWTEGGIRFIATVTPEDAKALLRIEGVRQARIDPSGSRIVFVSRADQTGYAAGGAAEVYLWSEADGQILCASCRADGSSPTGNATLLSSANSYLPTPENHDTRNIAADGSKVFFETTDALVRDDVNGAADVYAYPPGGTPRLVSDGKAKYGSFFFDASVSGDDVYFATQGSLVPQDTDNGENDVYDARVDGGFAPLPAPPNCSGEACQGTPSRAPAAMATSSNLLNAASGSSPRARARRGGKAGSKPLSITVRVKAAGRLTASGPGLVKVTRTFKRAGNYPVRLRLNRSGQTRLRTRGALRVPVVLDFRAPGDAAFERTVRVKFTSVNRRAK